MPEPANENEKKVPKNFRLPSKTIATVIELADFFNESQAEVIERAVELLNANKKMSLDAEYNKKLAKQ